MRQAQTIGAVFAMAALATPARPGWAQALVADTELHAVGLTRLWEAHVPLSPGDHIRKGYLLDDAIYVVSANGIIYSIQPDTGLIRWGEPFGGRGLLVDRPTHVRTQDGRGPVIFPIANSVYIADRYTGQLQHRLASLGFPLCSPVVGWGNALFAGSSTGHFHALLLSDRNPNEVGQLWTVSTNGRPVATPVFHRTGRLLVTTDAGLIYSMGAADKSLDWAQRVDAAIVAEPVVDTSGIYVASKDRSLYKLHPERGFQLWRARLPHPLTESPVLVAQTVFQFCEKVGMIALDAGSGVEQWRVPGARSFVIHAGGRDLLYTDDGRLVSIDHASGKQQASGSVALALEVLPNPDDSAVFMLGADGTVVCARSEGTPYLRRQQILAARERLNLPPPAFEPQTRPAPSLQPETDPRAKDPLRSRYDQGP